MNTTTGDVREDIDWVAEAANANKAMMDVFTQLHRHPEVGLNLPISQNIVLGALDGLPVEIHLGTSLSSIVAVLRGPVDGPVTVLRADLDALPLTEAQGTAVRSEIEGTMHACGHDLHAAMLVGAARILSAQRHDLPGTVVFLWQPGEEGFEGMAAMIQEGLLELINSLGDPVSSFGLHVLAGGALPNGVFAGRAGASHAATASFTIRVKGRGGHAAFPHQANDPVPAAAEIVTALQVRLTRALDVFNPAILTVGSIHGGDAHNVIPAEVCLSGTVRSFSQETSGRLGPLITRTAQAVAAAHSTVAETIYTEGYPPVINDPNMVTLFAGAVTGLFDENRYQELPFPLPAGDDYSRLLEHLPGAFLMLGASAPSQDGNYHPNHSPNVAFDPLVLPDGAAALARTAYLYLHQASTKEHK